MRLALTLFALLLFFAPKGAAEDARYQDYAVGGRALGLGGAFTALADDPSAVFFNAAGLVDVERTKISISTSLYGVELIGNSPVESATQRLNSGLSAADFIIVPSSSGFAMGFGKPNKDGAYRHAFGFGTLVPSFQSRYVETEDVNGDFRTLFRSRTIDRTLHAAAGYGFRAGPWLRIGFSAHYVLRTLDTEEEVLRYEDSAPGDTFLQSNAQLRTSIHAIRGTFGIKLRPGPRWSLGVHLLSPASSFYRDGQFSSELIDGREEQVVLERGDLNLKTDLDPAQLRWQNALPLTLRLGAAFSESEKYTLSGDIVIYGGGSHDLVSEAELAQNGSTALDRIPIPLTLDRQPVVNLAVGGERFFGKRFSISAGIFTNFTSAEELIFDADDPKTLAPESTRHSNINGIGGSLMFGFRSESTFSRLGITGSYGQGQGVVAASADERYANDIPPLQAEERSETFLYVFWSSTFKRGGKRGRGRFSL